MERGSYFVGVDDEASTVEEDVLVLCLPDELLELGERDSLALVGEASFICLSQPVKEPNLLKL